MQPYLKHYGVLGMKWGVRRNRAKTLTKASKKLGRLDRAADKASLKSTVARNKLLKAEGSYFSSPRSIAKKYKKANKAKLKARRKSLRALKWYNNMSKTIGNKDVSELKNSNGIKYGEKYATYLLNDTHW